MAEDANLILNRPRLRSQSAEWERRTSSSLSPQPFPQPAPQAFPQSKSQALPSFPSPIPIQNSSQRIHPARNQTTSTLPVPPNLEKTKGNAFAIVPTRTTTLQYAAGARAESLFPTVQTGALQADVMVAAFKSRVQDFLADHVAVVRLASHLSVLFVVGVILSVHQFSLPQWDVSLNTLTTNIAEVASVRDHTAATTVPALLQSSSDPASSGDRALRRMILPITFKPEQPKLAISAYIVQKGDTVFGIASRLGLNPESIQWANPNIENNPDLLELGQTLKVPPANGVLYASKNGDSLAALAKRFQTPIEQVLAFAGNQLPDASAELKLGQEIFFPGGVKPFEPIARTPPAPAKAAVTKAQRPWNAVLGSGLFSWPTSGEVSQGYWAGHRAIDIASWTGNPVKAADSGYVVEVVGGWSSGYGLHVLIDHGNGFQTLYAHLSSVSVKVGESITKGQYIGAVGSTGNSTGPHLHFEIRSSSGTLNPYSYLR